MDRIDKIRVAAALIDSWCSVKKAGLDTSQFSVNLETLINALLKEATAESNETPNPPT